LTAWAGDQTDNLSDKIFFNIMEDFDKIMKTLFNTLILMRFF